MCHLVFNRETVASQDYKEHRDQLGPLATQAQMVSLELMDRLELQEEMVQWDSQVHQDSGVSQEQWEQLEHQEIPGTQEQREIKALLDKQDPWDQRAKVEVLVVKVDQVFKDNKGHQENLD